MEKFMDDRLKENAPIEFYEPVKKLNLHTFQNITKVVKVSVKDRMVPIKSHRYLFGQMSIIMQQRDVDLKNVFSYPLGPLPWSLTGPVGELRKTNKVSLLHKLEKGVKSLVEPPNNHAAIIDGMAVVQKFKPNGLTFKQLASDTFKSIISMCKAASRVDIVFDVYRAVSIKNAERVRRSSSKLMFSKIIPSQVIRQWQSFLSNSCNKTAPIKFLCNQWQSEKYFEMYCDKHIYITCEQLCYQLNGLEWSQVEELDCTQEEADTRTLLQVKHATNNGYQDIIIHQM